MRLDTPLAWPRFSQYAEGDWLELFSDDPIEPSGGNLVFHGYGYASGKFAEEPIRVRPGNHLLSEKELAAKAIAKDKWQQRAAAEKEARDKYLTMWRYVKSLTAATEHGARIVEAAIQTYTDTHVVCELRAADGFVFMFGDTPYKWIKYDGRFADMVAGLNSTVMMRTYELPLNSRSQLEQL